MRIINATIYRAANLIRRLGYDFQEAKDPSVIRMVREIRQIGGEIEFKIEQDKDGNWVAESINVDGILTGGTDIREVPDVLKDAVFTYYGIRPHLCHSSILRSANEPVVMKQRVYV